MIYSHNNQQRRQTLSKKQLILFLMKASSKLIDLITSALKSNDFTLYKLYSPNHPQTSTATTNYISANEKHAYEMINLLK